MKKEEIIPYLPNEHANLNYIFVKQNILHFILKNNIHFRFYLPVLASFFMLLMLVGKPYQSWAQFNRNKLIELSGIILSVDSLKVVSDAQILSKKNFLGSFSDTLGRFNIIVCPDDSLMFSSLGYTPRIIRITDSILALPRPVTFLMSLDTILIHEIVIHAFWDYETFKQMIIHMEPAPYINISKELEENPLLYKQPTQSLTMKGPIQALYDLLNQKAVIQRKLIRNRREYNRKMIQLGRPQDTIPTTLDYMREKQH